MLVAAFVTAAVFPTAALAAVPVALLSAAVVFFTSMHWTGRLQMMLAYPFTATLFATQCAATRCVLFRYAENAGLLV